MSVDKLVCIPLESGGFAYIDPDGVTEVRPTGKGSDKAIVLTAANSSYVVELTVVHTVALLRSGGISAGGHTLEDIGSRDE